MNQPKTRTRYVHIASKHRLETITDKADIKVHLQQPIKNVYRVAVKSFTMANALFNIRSGENTLDWVEYVNTEFGYKSKAFQVVVPTGYYSAEQLCSAINAQILAMSDHIVSTNADEQPLLMHFSQDQEYYTISIDVERADGDLNDKWIALSHTRHSIWRLLGFTDNQTLNQIKRKYESNDEIASVLPYPGEGLNFLHQAGFSGSPNVFNGNLPATIESPAGIYLTSDTLTSGGTYETRTHPDSLHLDAVPQAILEFIQFDQSRYSWIHYNSAMPHYHYLNDTNITDIDIQLRSENGTILTHSEVGEYNLVLVFECLVEDEYSPEFIKAYNQYGYNLAHTPERIVFPPR